jgi:hypothetical protein
MWGRQSGTYEAEDKLLIGQGLQAVGPGYRSQYSVSLRLESPGIESRWGARFSAPVQTGPRGHPASYKMGARSFPRVKRPGRGVDHPPSPTAEVKERV